MENTANQNHNDAESIFPDTVLVESADSQPGGEHADNGALLLSV